MAIQSDEAEISSLLNELLKTASGQSSVLSVADSPRHARALLDLIEKVGRSDDVVKRASLRAQSSTAPA